jgi:uncharacterized membrane protein YjjP (DUF1212 family)
MAASTPHWLGHQLARLLKTPSAATRLDREELAARDVLAMVEAFGLGMIEVGQAVNDVEEALLAIGKAYGITDLRAVVLPTFIVLQSEMAGGVAQIESSRPGGGRLDQAGALEMLEARALRTELEPADAIAQLTRIRTAKPRFGPWASLLGHVVLTVGFGMVINPTLQAIPVYAGLGLGVGALILLSRRYTGLTSATSVVAAFLVTLVTSLLLTHVVGDQPLRIIAPPLVAFLPGLTLTVAAIELTSNQVIAGASRLVYGVGQLLLLTFGVFAGTAISGGLHAGAQEPTLGWWAGLVGVGLVALGFVLFMSAPRGAFLWIAVSLAVCYGAQALGAVTLGPALSGFLGAVVVAPFALIATRFRTSPPASVMSLASYWLLVPGAFGFIGLAGVSQAGSGSIQTLLTAGISVLSIALGAIVGIGLSRDAGRLRRLARRR